MSSFVIIITELKSLSRGYKCCHTFNGMFSLFKLPGIGVKFFVGVSEFEGGELLKMILQFFFIRH